MEEEIRETEKSEEGEGEFWKKNIEKTETAERAQKETEEKPRTIIEEPEEEFKIEGIRVWQILTAVLAILLIASILTKGFRFEQPTGVAIAEEPPTPPTTEAQRSDVDVDDDPQRGPSDAKVTIIEFSDFQCPFCKKAQPTLEQIEEMYGDDVRFVYRDFPLSFHENAQKAAEAAECADEQEKFWKYHDVLFENQDALDTSSLKKYASDLGLDTTKFNECLGSGKYESEVNKDIQDGLKAGVRGTPAFFINGRLVSGAQPFASFKKVIDEELA